MVGQGEENKTTALNAPSLDYCDTNLAIIRSALCILPTTIHQNHPVQIYPFLFDSVVT